MEGFFGNASGMLRPGAEVHVTNKTAAPFCDWNIKELAYKHCLSLMYRVNFKKEDYPGYSPSPWESAVPSNLDSIVLARGLE